ncbi:MAG TPA: ATP-binding cassette domain-containing protein [Ferruginibacter sp.]|nr:ABC transporter ATP-binding protein [Chitinophagaceae bacterium]HRI23887.1 ATP-binding cassette domain-containing protein [Ferruginibacter sp.]
MTHRLEIDSVTLEFGTRRLLTDIYLECSTGLITGLLGRNGEGKSCLLNIIFGTQSSSSKSARFDGIAIYKAFKRPDLLTFLPQFSFLPGFLSPRRIFSDFNISYQEFETHFPEFNGLHNFKIKNLSSGNKRLLEVYLIIKSRAQFSILDEPFSRLTPLQTDKIIDLLIANKSAKGFLLTDHLYENILTVCDQIYVLSAGKTYFSKSLDDIRHLGYIK